MGFILSEKMRVFRTGWKENIMENETIRVNNGMEENKSINPYEYKAVLGDVIANAKRILK